MSIVRWTLLVVLVLGAMLVASLSADSHGWQASVRWASERAAQWRREAPECPVLHGEAKAGSSRAGYEAAARLAAGVNGKQLDRLRELVEATGDAGLPTAEDRELLATLAPAAEALRVAAHQQGTDGGGVTPAAWPTSDGLFELLGLHAALLLQARDQTRNGDLVGAFDCLLDGLACGVDLTTFETPLVQSIGAFVVQKIVLAFEEALLQQADIALLARLADALAKADAALTVESRMPAQAAVHVVSMLREKPVVDAQDLGMATPLCAWRHGFSVRRSGMARAEQLTALVQRFERESTPSETWPSRRLRLLAVVAEDRANNSDLFSPFLERAVELEEQRREASAHLRLLRLAVAFHRRAPLPDLQDPLGEGALTVTTAGDSATFASVGHGIERVLHRRR